MSKVNNDKSETKKKDRDNQKSFQKNDGDFHERKDTLNKPVTSPVEGAFGKETLPKP